MRERPTFPAMLISMPFAASFGVSSKQSVVEPRFESRFLADIFKELMLLLKCIKRNKRRSMFCDHMTSV